MTETRAHKSPDREPFSYQDELVLVRHLVDDLERRLAGRHERRVLRTLPSDHCHLGVLSPRDPDVAQPEALEEEAEDGTGMGAVAEGGAGVGNGPSGPAGPEGAGDAAPGESDAERSDGEGEEEASFGSAEQAEAERRGAGRDATRRPPSSLGFEIEAEPGEDGDGELTVSGSFAVYTQHFPTFEEQRRQLGEADGGAGHGGANNSPRAQVSLLEVYERRRVEVPALTFRLEHGRGKERLTDDGQVQRALDSVLDSAVAEPDIRRELRGPATVPAQALAAPEDYERHLRGATHGGPIRPPLRASLDLRVSPADGGGIRVRCYLKNDTPRDPVRRSVDQRHVLADCQLEGCVTRGELRPVEILPVPKDYQYDRQVWAVGHGASAEVDEPSAAGEPRRKVRTRTLARYEQPRQTTVREPVARFEDLARDPFGALERIRRAMAEYAADWRERVVEGNELGLDPEGLAQCREDLEAFVDEESRFAAGIAALAADERLLRAFVSMNEVFGRTSAGRYDRWRLFQIAFIVTQLPALAVREGVSRGEWPSGEERSWENALDWADVLWFPTGGGKTEAYLGLISCAALYDRLRGKSFGVTAWLRFPLRMLSVQQLQRAAKVLYETEQQRRSLLGESSRDSDSISLGYFVGGTSTPNQLRTDGGRWSFERLERDPKLREKLLLVGDCPACGRAESVEVVPDRAAHRIRHVCAECQAELAVYVSDDEVYRFLPTVVIGTIDKMAAVAWNPKFGMLWGGAAWRCPEHDEHGYGLGDFCVYGCPTNPTSGRSRPRVRTVVTPYDGAPSLHVQDELHLLQEELGAFAGHYETLVRSCEAAVGGLPPKTIAATATIEGFEHQVRHVYGVPHARRFPGRGYNRLGTFYAAPDRETLLTSERKAKAPAEAFEGGPKTARLYVAFRPPHLHAADAASLCARLLHEEIVRLYEDPYGTAAWLPTARTEEEVRALLRYYSTTLTYVGSKARGLRVRQGLDREAGRIRPGGARDLSTEFLSGDSSLADIAGTVRKVEAPPDWAQEGHLDATVATSVISHGVDVERFNLMVMDGIPEETAAYIQASSRSGRRHVGLVLAVLASYSIRASSIYHRFNEYHAHLDRLVSPVPVNRFAKYAAQRTAPGVLTGLLLGRYGVQSKRSNLGKRNVAAELLTPSERTRLPFQVAPVDFLRDVETAYALADGVYPEGLELAMDEVLKEQTRRFVLRVRGGREDKVVDVVRPAPMTSLRDVDVGVGFQPAPDSDWQELQHFRRS
ncbi:hypothetical protein GBA63_22300 (plasmid) [Rubrobacter tropicus]|uniref:Helicase C-terminal domain-containing protein n=1 Tax=Rubrobacter tropicus TaxID=2653851 RepID=A0A6G8QG10_9ACTN|nr:helicase-related protein [Rubrobacter tropicus]QIN85435.1 hypothetical protein GBA63_22300 [Rubrobacter tropicus]